MKLATLLLLCLAVAPTAARADHATDADLTSAASWCATAARVVRGRRDGSLPMPYARRTLTIATGRLMELQRSFAERHDAAHRDRIVRATDVVDRARQALDRGDDAALATLPDDLDHRAASLVPAR